MTRKHQRATMVRTAVVAALLAPLGAHAATYWLNVTKPTTGLVASTPKAIYCGAIDGRSWLAGECSKSFAGGTIVTLKATPKAGYAFSAWSGACTGKASTCSVTMSRTTKVTATFVAASTPTPTPTP
ncbi:MAG: hypothetical protein IT496_07385, partial [Gammaproteobacteria bacterium]|nr:hypothetical protein [Gammaproteobacteria bacterium]